MGFDFVDMVQRPLVHRDLAEQMVEAGTRLRRLWEAAMLSQASVESEAGQKVQSVTGTSTTVPVG